MAIKKKRNKYAVVHCHGKEKKETIGTHSNKESAVAHHKAIMVNKKPVRRKKK